jgi:hypothetical protein
MIARTIVVFITTLLRQSVIVCAVAVALLGASGLSAAAPGTQPAASGLAAERQRWQAVIEFYGEEDSGRWSLRMSDKAVTAPARFEFVELWSYDAKQKTWVKIDAEPRGAAVVPAAQKPADAPQGYQLLAELPIEPETVGLYYCKWKMNGIDGVTFARIGPGLADKGSEPGPPPAGTIVAIVPVDKNHARREFIPDPRTHTGQAAATRRSK